jgi:hypothetical protein
MKKKCHILFEWPLWRLRRANQFEWMSISTLKRHSLGLDFINVLRTAFTHVVPQSVRTQSSHQYLFTLLGPTSVKAVRRTLMKLSPGVNFINMFMRSFHALRYQKQNKDWRLGYLFLHICDLRAWKLCANMLMK